MNGRHPQNPNRGFSLVELMVAMVISLILLGGVIKIYESSKQAYRAQDGQARLQENGRFAMYFLAKDIRMAGYMGCNQLSQVNPNVIADNPPMTPLFSAETVIGGYDGGTWPASFPAEPAKLVKGTDAILVRHASSTGASLTGGPMSGKSAEIKIGSNPGNYQAGDLLFITDCSSADIFRATSVSNVTGGIITIAHASGNISNKLSKAYGTNAQVMAFEYSLYYISATATPGVDALYRVTANSGPEELVDGVRNMQFLYGVDTDGNGSVDEYRTASEVDAITDGWSDVVSVRVSLLLVSQGNFLTQIRQELRFNGALYTAPDNRMYAAFSDTVALRNRIP